MWLRLRPCPSAHQGGGRGWRRLCESGAHVASTGVQLHSKEGGAGDSERTEPNKAETVHLQCPPRQGHIAPLQNQRAFSHPGNSKHPLRATSQRLSTPEGQLRRNGSHPLLPFTSTFKINPRHPQSLSQLVPGGLDFFTKLFIFRHIWHILSFLNCVG